VIDAGERDSARLRCQAMLPRMGRAQNHFDQTTEIRSNAQLRVKNLKSGRHKYEKHICT